MKRPARRGRIALGAVLAILVAVVLLWDWNWFRRPVEYVVHRQTGRHLEIRGDLDVNLGWKPRFILNDLHFENADWASQPEMVSAEHVEIAVDLRGLLGGRLEFPAIVLVAPTVNLEAAADGRQNWAFDSAAKEPKPKKEAQSEALPAIGSLLIERGQLSYLDKRDKTNLVLNVSTDSSKQENGTLLTAGGRFKGMEVEAKVSGGPLLSLADLAAPYTLDAKFRLGRTRGSVAGTVAGLQTFASAKLKLDVRGDTLAALHPLTALVLPETPPYHIAGLLVHEGETWTFNDFTGEVGDSDLGGNVTVTYHDDRPRMVADLQSRQLDLDDLAGFVGATPDTGKGETASAPQKQEAQREEAQPRVLPDKPVDLAALRSMDADVKFQALSIRNKELLVDNLKVHLLLDHGKLRLDPLDFGVAGGAIVSTLNIDAAQPTLVMDAKVDVSRLDLAKLMPGNAQVAKGTGLIGGRAVLNGKGASTAALLGSLNGELGIAMSGGKFSNLLIEGVGLDVAEALRLFISGDHSVRLRCAVADLTAKDGVITPRALVVDTTDTNLHVEGSLSLRDETLDLSIHPLPKDFSPLTLRSPLHIRGTFKEPVVRPDRKLYLRGGAAAVLGALVNPLVALLPLIETGPGKNADCDKLLAATQRKVPASKP